MTKYKLEYIWLDGKKPIPELRGKTLIKSFDRVPALGDLPKWGFDGSSTMQAEAKALTACSNRSLYILTRAARTVSSC